MPLIWLQDSRRLSGGYFNEISLYVDVYLVATTLTSIRHCPITGARHAPSLSPKYLRTLFPGGPDRMRKQKCELFRRFDPGTWYILVLSCGVGKYIKPRVIYILSSNIPLLNRLWSSGEKEPLLLMHFFWLVGMSMSSHVIMGQ